MQDLIDEIRTTVYLEGISVIIFIGVASVLMLLVVYRLLYAGTGDRLSGFRATSAGILLAVLLILPMPIMFLFRPGVSARQTVGEILYRDECAVCHGTQGNRLPGIALGSREYLMRLGDAALERVIKEGKGVMPAWGRDREGPLRDDEIHLIVDYLKASARAGEEGAVPEGGAAVSPPAVGTPSVDAGRQLFANNCATCHGENGSRIPGADLSSKAFLDARDDAALATAISEGKGSMPGFSVEKEGPLAETDIRSVVAFLRTLGQGAEATEEADAGSQPEVGGPSADVGRQSFADNCSGCHGENGARIVAADLSSKGFLDVRDDATLVSVIRQGKSGMPAFGAAEGGLLSDSEVESIVAFLRTLAVQP